VHSQKVICRTLPQPAARAASQPLAAPFTDEALRAKRDDHDMKLHAQRSLQRWTNSTTNAIRSARICAFTVRDAFDSAPHLLAPMDGLCTSGRSYLLRRPPADACPCATLPFSWSDVTSDRVSGCV
jgi:hypothetical protein